MNTFTEPYFLQAAGAFSNEVILYDGLRFYSEIGTNISLVSEQNAPYVELQYSFNGKKWYVFNGSVYVGAKRNIYFRGENNAFSKKSKYSHFVFSNKVEAHGNILSIMYGDDRTKNEVAEEAFYCLFIGASITTAPELPATTLTKNCYTGMFAECRSLTTAPKLPATTLANYCYSKMFAGCSSLTTAPELPATTLADNCYSQMFNECERINSIKANFMTEPGTNYTKDWLGGVSTNGIFYENDNATWEHTIERNSDTIPQSWTIKKDHQNTYFYLRAKEDTSIKFIEAAYHKASFEYSKDLKEWDNFVNDIDFELKAGETCYFKGKNETLGGLDDIGEQYDGARWETSGAVYAGGNIMSLLYSDDYKKHFEIKEEACFYRLFYESKILSAPALPATVLTYSCYLDMFMRCSSLTTAPELPATTLAGNCYSYMFYGCSSLTTAPKLPATALTDICYDFMFCNCTKLATVEALFLSTPGENTRGWLENVASSGTFICSASATWASSITRGISTVPEGWTIKTDADA